MQLRVNSNEPTTLFVYGSLRDPDRREEIVGRQVATIPATLSDYEPGRARYYFIRPRKGVSTSGLLLLNLTTDNLRALDCYEEVPRLYTREKAEVSDENGNRVRCWMYVPTASTLRGEE